METLSKNLDDAMERLEKDTQKISGRSARIKRRIEVVTEEIRGVKMHLDCFARLVLKTRIILVQGML